MTAFASKSCDYDNLWANPHFVGPQPEIGHVLNVRFLTQNVSRLVWTPFAWSVVFKTRDHGLL